MIARFRKPDERFWSQVRLIELGLCLPFVVFFYWIHPPASGLLLLIPIALAWIRLDIAVALLPLALPYYLALRPLWPGGFPAFSIGELSLLICLGVAVARTLLLPVDRQATWEWAHSLWHQARLFLLPAMLLLIGASLALLASPDRHTSLRAYREEIIEPLLYFLLILRYLRTRTDLARTAAAFILSATITAGIGLIQGTIYQKWYYVNATTLRVDGPYGSANNLGMFLERALPLALALALTHLLRRPAVAEAIRRPVWRDPLRWVCLFVSLPLLSALYLTDSRGAEAGTLAALLFLFIVEVRQWLMIAVMFLIGAAGGWLLWPRIVRLSEEGHAGTVSERFLYWKAAALIIRDHFFLGTGPDSFVTQYSPYRPATSKNPNPDSYALKALNGQPFPATYDPGISHPHNMILDFWISSGLLGLAALLWLLGAVATMLVRLYRSAASLRQGDLLQRLLLGIAASMIALVVHGMVDNSYFLPDLSMIFWFLIGLLLVIGGLAQQEQPTNKPDQPASASEQSAPGTVSST